MSKKQIFALSILGFFVTSFSYSQEKERFGRFCPKTVLALKE
ncbi:hypothetical protein PALB_23090 [Pseudoalteromonas luteoviolacea B = ATCC 29581]|nr:hypothetical protein PALB_23090 [Pseudoalteromonas luteoviolacea B = ATCC 29581]